MAFLERGLNRLLSVFIVVLTILLLACVVWQVISRYVTASPSIVTDELSRFLFMWLTMIGAAYTAGLKRHLSIDLLPGGLTGAKKRILVLCIQGVVAVFSLLVLVYGGLLLAQKTLASGQVTPALGIAMGYVYLCLPISGLLIVFYAFCDSVKILTEGYRSELNEE